MTKKRNRLEKDKRRRGRLLVFMKRDLPDRAAKEREIRQYGVDGLTLRRRKERPEDEEQTHRFEVDEQKRHAKDPPKRPPPPPPKEEPPKPKPTGRGKGK